MYLSSLKCYCIIVLKKQRFSRGHVLSLDNIILFKPATVKLTLGAGFRRREALGYYDRLLPIYHPHDKGKMEAWLKIICKAV
jgi:hypothetical protein